MKSILFSGPMVRATLDGRKTQTRRIVKPQPRQNDGGEAWWWSHPKYNNGLGCNYFHTQIVSPSIRKLMAEQCAPYRVGDTLWVRETFATMGDEEMHTTHYRADMPHLKGAQYGWKPSIHMPRWAARLFLTVTAVRVERLQEISDSDAYAEGVDEWAAWEDPRHSDGTPAKYKSSRAAFEALWDSLNAKRAPWSSNPWVWVIEFEKQP